MAHIYEWGIQSCLEALCMGRASNGGSRHGGFQWSHPNVTICPATQSPQEENGKFSHLACKLTANPHFSMYCLIPSHTCPHVPKPALPRFNPWWIKFALGCGLRKAGIVPGEMGWGTTQGYHAPDLGPAPYPVFKWHRFLSFLWFYGGNLPVPHWLLFARGGAGGGGASRFFSVLPSQSASQLPADTSVSLWASTCFTPFLLL